MLCYMLNDAPTGLIVENQDTLFNDDPLFDYTDLVLPTLGKQATSYLVIPTPYISFHRCVKPFYIFPTRNAGIRRGVHYM